MFEVKAHMQQASAKCRDRAAWMLRGNRLVIGLADGADNNPDSGFAAEYAINAVMQAVGTEANPLPAAEWARIVKEIDMPLSLEPSGETALVVVDVGAGVLSGAAVGDCAAWLIDTGVTNLTAKQKRKPLLGSAAAVATAFSASAKGVLLLASDGLHRYAAQDKVAAACLSMDAAAVTALSRLPNGKWYDDATAVLVRKANVQTITPQGRITWVQ